MFTRLGESCVNKHSGSQVSTYAGWFASARPGGIRRRAVMRMQVLGVGAVGSAAVATALFGAGTAAAAPDVVGMKYADAQEEIVDGGGSAVVAARVGDQLDEGDCVVTNAWEASFLRIDSADDGEIQVVLNCAGGYATATDPGASVASPLGRLAKTKAEEEAAEQEEEELAAPETPGE